MVREKGIRFALAMAGSDPTGGAGLQADLSVFKSFGVRGLSAATALTAQNTSGVAAVMPVPAEFVRRQLETLLADIRPDAMKTGMLWGRGIIETIADIIKKGSLKNLVIDPVTISSSGASLLEEGGIEALRKKLLPLSLAVTPNLDEAGLLCGTRVKGLEEMEDAALRIRDMGAKIVIITGGHLEDEAIDLYFDGRDFVRLAAPKLPGSFHGTGCAFSAALTALIALGEPPLDAAKKAKEFMNGAIKNAFHPGRGMGILRL